MAVLSGGTSRAPTVDDLAAAYTTSYGRASGAMVLTLPGLGFLNRVAKLVETFSAKAAAVIADGVRPTRA